MTKFDAKDSARAAVKSRKRQSIHRSVSIDRAFDVTEMLGSKVELANKLTTLFLTWLEGFNKNDEQLSINAQASLTRSIRYLKMFGIFEEDKKDDETYIFPKIIETAEKFLNFIDPTR